MKKKKFNVSLFSTSIEVVNSLIIGAAAHNGGIAETTLHNLKTMGEGLQKQFKSSIDMNFELIGENQLCIDAKIKGDWQPIAVIEAVEVFEIPRGKDNNEDTAEKFALVHSISGEIHAAYRSLGEAKAHRENMKHPHQWTIQYPEDIY